ncbi:hypothetical protein ACIBKX_08510 [Streptomyces sp. NPDC050658]|uniref:effector-associated constant component EACC1 n=1 Tax=unclassified Streptomyces TaxID=2593676 RepID=UPI0034391F40
MQVKVTFGEGATDADADGTESAASLYRWLMAEPELRGSASLSTGAERSAPGHMGDGLELVNVVLANSIALGSLITAVAAWRGSRPRPPQVRLERDGVVVTLRDDSPEQVERILRMWNATGESSPVPADGDSE